MSKNDQNCCYIFLLSCVLNVSNNVQTQIQGKGVVHLLVFHFHSWERVRVSEEVSEQKLNIMEMNETLKWQQW